MEKHLKSLQKQIQNFSSNMGYECQLLDAYYTVLDYNSYFQYIIKKDINQIDENST